MDEDDRDARSDLLDVAAGPVVGRDRRHGGDDGESARPPFAPGRPGERAPAGCATLCLRHSLRQRPVPPRDLIGGSPVAKVTMPQLGESVAEGTIGKWLKQPGDHVAKYEPLVEVITDKVNAEVPSPFEGILQRDPGRGRRDRPEQRRDRRHRDRRRRRGDGASTAAEPHRLPRRSRPPRRRRPPRRPEPPRRRRRSRAAAATALPAPTSAAGESAAAAATRARRPRADAPPRPHRRPGRPHDPRRPPPAPRARPDAAQIAGTGGGGRITRDDVLASSRHPHRPAGPRPPPAAAAAAAPAPRRARLPPRLRPRPTRARRAGRPTPAPIAFPAGADEVLVPMTQMRKGIAAQMTRALPGAARVRPDGGRRHEPGQVPRAQEARLPGEGGDRRSASCRSWSRPRPRRSSATRPSMPTGPSRACSPSGGSTSASPSRSTTA